MFQTNFFDSYNSLCSLKDNNVTHFFSVLKDNFKISDFVPLSFSEAFYKSFGRKRKYNLISFLNALLIKSLFKIPTVASLITFLKASKEYASFCNFSQIPDETKFSKFLTSFSEHINNLFNNIADFVQPICFNINPKLANTLILDTTGIVSCVKENNPKFVNSIIKNLKKFHKADKTFNPYSAAYSSMPKSPAASDATCKLSFVNGEFCYANKFAILTNGLGIPCKISLLEKDSFFTDSPDYDKSISDSKCLKPIISDYLAHHKNFIPYTFIGDSAFDNQDTYDFLLRDCKFERVVIPINSRATKFNNTNDFDSFGTPFCKTAQLPFKFVGNTGGKNRSPRFKFSCPLSYTDKKGKLHTSCSSPCSDSSCRVRYVNSSSNNRLYPGSVPRNTEHFDNIYKQRTVIERTINTIKAMSFAHLTKTRNPKTMTSNLLFGAIAQLSILILSTKLKLKSFKSFNSLLKAA